MKMKMKPTIESSQGSVTQKSNMTPKYKTTGTVVKKKRGTKLTKIDRKQWR